MTLIKDAGLKFPKARVPLKNPTKIVIHHPAARWTVQRTHEYHISIEYNGIGYNYYVQQNGEAFYGRSTANQEYQGAHALGRNHDTIGVCAEGNFEIEYMQPIQYNKLLEVVVFLCKKHNLTEKDVVGHKELPGQNTACPGKNFDLNKFRADVKAKLNQTSGEDKQMQEQIKNLENRIIQLENQLAAHNAQEPSKWASKDWEIAKENGYFDGTRPLAPITRQEAAIVVNRLRHNFLKLIGENREMIMKLEKRLAEIERK